MACETVRMKEDADELSVVKKTFAVGRAGFGSTAVVVVTVPVVRRLT